jgi:hypothetical protein
MAGEFRLTVPCEVHGFQSAHSTLYLSLASLLREKADIRVCRSNTSLVACIVLIGGVRVKRLVGSRGFWDTMMVCPSLLPIPKSIPGLIAQYLFLGLFCGGDCRI